jgi:PBSX family phage portal protein
MATQKHTEATQLASKKSPELTVIAKVIKGDTYMVMADSAKEIEDEFKSFYSAGSNNKNAIALEPPYSPRTLKSLPQKNNILLQCIDAMEVNIDGTGHEFVPSMEGVEIDEGEKLAAEQFFAEPYPGQSFLMQRRLLRNDLESIGFGFLEALRTLDKTLVGLRHIPAQSMRLVRLEGAVQVPHKVMRGGQEITLMLSQRLRRFVHTTNGTDRTFFKEIGCPIDLNKETGEWATPGQIIPLHLRASEVLYFGVKPDTNTPYYTPRWINQLPSVLGSRKAEEQNLEFFDSGGMPPAIIFLQGGSMVGDSANQLRTYLSGANKRKGRAVVVEVASNSGSIDGGGGAVQTKVERFGADRLGDGMYSKYDTQTEEHVRVAFRLPPLFIGRSTDYNYATAQVAYMIAEEQVFAPERIEFDETVNRTIIKALGLKTLKFKSNPITLKSVDERFKGLEMLDTKIKGADVVAEVNRIIGTDFQYDKETEDKARQAAADAKAKFQSQMGVQQGDGQPLVPQPPVQSIAEPQTAHVEAEDGQPKVDDSALRILKYVRILAEADGHVESFAVRKSEEVSEARAYYEGLADKSKFDALLSAYVAPGHDHVH